MHLHNYRLVCAVGTCFTRGEDCTRCRGRNTLPGVRLNCRASVSEAAVYGASLALWQRRLAASVDAFVVPSAFALRRLRELGAPLGDRAQVIPSMQRSFASASAAASGGFALAAGRLTPEKGFADAVAACSAAGVPLVVAGHGPQLNELRALGGDVRFVGHVGATELARLRSEAALAIVPSRYAEILPLAALEAMAAGLPVVASRAGGLAETVPEEGLYSAGDAAAAAERVRALYGDAAAGERALARARARFAPTVVAAQLRRLYD
jgi:glycosyltransferase involved in cell wall biosynthesis